MFWFVIWVGGFMPQWAPFCAEYMSGRKKASQVWKTFSTRNFRQPQIQSKFLIYINIYVCKNARIGKTGKLVWTRPSSLYGKQFKFVTLTSRSIRWCLQGTNFGPVTDITANINYIIQGPVVQSVVSLTSSLRVISLTVLADSIYNILIFFCWKNVSSFCTHIFSAKNFSIFAYHSM